MKIYLVYGGVGAWDDRAEWNVKAFTDFDKAEEYSHKASLRARELVDSRPETFPEKNEWYKQNEYDSNMQVVGDEAPIYDVQELELVEG